MDCTTNNNFRMINGENFEIKQVEPGNKCISDRTSKLSEIASDAKNMELGVLELELKKAKTEKEKKALQAKISKLESSIDFSLTSRIMNEANDILILGTLKGNYFEKGYFKCDGKEIDFTAEVLEEMPPEIYRMLLKNAEELIEIKEAEEKNL